MWTVTLCTILVTVVHKQLTWQPVMSMKFLFLPKAPLKYPRIYRKKKKFNMDKNTLLCFVNHKIRLSHFFLRKKKQVFYMHVAFTEEFFFWFLVVVKEFQSKVLTLYICSYIHTYIIWDENSQTHKLSIDLKCRHGENMQHYTERFPVKLTPNIFAVR